MKIRAGKAQAASLGVMLTSAILSTAAWGQTSTAGTPKSSSEQGHSAQCERMTGAERQSCEQRMRENAESVGRNDASTGMNAGKQNANRNNNANSQQNRTSIEPNPSTNATQGNTSSRSTTPTPGNTGANDRANTDDMNSRTRADRTRMSQRSDEIGKNPAPSSTANQTNSTDAAPTRSDTSGPTQTTPNRSSQPSDAAPSQQDRARSRPNENNNRTENPASPR
ncbi:MAG TPA: hypothetical protein VNA21_09585 [Steroidobacteraceae bacterium]|nr:hypothetical protein [Steroidobacteraceae bacterium]